MCAVASSSSSLVGKSFRPILRSQGMPVQPFKLSYSNTCTNPGIPVDPWVNPSSEKFPHGPCRALNCCLEVPAHLLAILVIPAVLRYCLLVQLALASPGKQMHAMVNKSMSVRLLAPSKTGCTVAAPAFQAATVRTLTLPPLYRTQQRKQTVCMILAAASWWQVPDHEDDRSGPVGVRVDDPPTPGDVRLQAQSDNSSGELSTS